MKFYSRLVLVVLLIFSSTAAVAQNSIPISDEGTIEITNCDNTLTITDSNDGEDGNYLPNEIYQMTICTNTVLGDPIQIAVLPQQNANDTINLWGVDGSSTLTVYEGTGTGGAQLGIFNSVTHPDGFFLQVDANCITLVWESGEASSSLGFIAQVNCLQELQPFNVSVFIDPPFGLSTDTFPDIGPDENVITFCFGDTLNFTANPSFPLSNAEGTGYEQLAEECTYTWDMGNGDVFEDVGLNTLTYGFPNPGGYFATLTITDVMGQEETYDAYLLMAPRPVFSNIIFGDTLCLGDTTIITGGILFPDTVGVSPSTSAVQPNYNFTDSRYLPDITTANEIYSTTIEIEGYLDDPIIMNPGDFVNVCLNMEHTYLGDLEAWLTCPNGQTAALFQGFGGAGVFPGDGFGGGGTYLGDANDGPEEDEGIGFDYCFADDGPLLTMGEEFAAGNTVPVNTFQAGNAMVAGSYTPEDNFETSFDGCPLNGDWTLNIADNLGADDGYIFEWSMEFGPDFELDTIYYTPDIIDAYWIEDEDIVFNSDTSVTIVPQTPGNNTYTFVAEDSFGCIHDTTFSVYVRPLPVFNSNIACFLIDSLNPNNDPAGGVYEILDTPTETADLIFSEENEFGFTTINATEYGIYTIEFTENNCAYTDQAEIDFRPFPLIEPFFEDTVLCGGSSIVYDAGAQEANSDNFFINWTQDGNTYNTTDYSTTVSTSGEIILTITGVCGVAADTSNITAIEVTFEGDTICDLVPRFTSVDVAPESVGGSWSASSDGIIFSAPNAVATEIIAPEFGDYTITYTDVRCPADVVSRNFKWYEQPDLTILPTNPIICYETDTLNLSAVLQGAGNGDYFWELTAINTGGGAPPVDFDLDQNQSFPPESFDPEVNYMATVESFDEFGRCPEPGRDTLIFKPIACLYDIPNVITPNDDGLNDLFVIRNIEDFPNASLAIFNRWGQEVFSSTSYDQYQAQNGGWDPEDNAGGVYFIELKLPSIDVIESGNLTIITEQGSEQ
jgi:gliding motility-associated-like protein